MKSEEIPRVKSELKKGLDSIRNYISNPGDVLNKALVFENDLKTDGHISALKVVAIMVEFNQRMELTLAEMKKLLLDPISKPIGRAAPAPTVRRSKLHGLSRTWVRLRSHITLLVLKGESGTQRQS